MRDPVGELVAVFWGRLLGRQALHRGNPRESYPSRMRENLGGVPTAHPLGDLASKEACLSGLLMPRLFRAVRLHMSLTERTKKESHQTDCRL